MEPVGFPCSRGLFAPKCCSVPCWWIWRRGRWCTGFGEKPGGIYGLVSGTVAVNTSPPAATPRLIHIGAPGFWTGEGSFLTRQPRRIEMQAITAATMMHLPLHSMDQMEARDPRVVRNFAQILMINVDILIRIVHDLQQPDTARRIAAVLNRAGWIGDRPIPLTQAELGAMANASRKQVNAVLQRFAKEGWISNTYRNIGVLDSESLRRFATGDDA
jgi:CRP/FNR family cyclic AMP-dependent transcriptional regulator